jgi:hypothetical protein
MGSPGWTYATKYSSFSSSFRRIDFWAAQPAAAGDIPWPLIGLRRGRRHEA